MGVQKEFVKDPWSTRRGMPTLKFEFLPFVFCSFFVFHLSIHLFFCSRGDLYIGQWVLKVKRNEMQHNVQKAMKQFIQL